MGIAGHILQKSNALVTTGSHSSNSVYTGGLSSGWVDVSLSFLPLAAWGPWMVSYYHYKNDRLHSNSGTRTLKGGEQHITFTERMQSPCCACPRLECVLTYKHAL